MNYFLKVDKNILKYSLVILIIMPIFGINFVIGLLSNILILLLLIPLLIIVLVFFGFTYYKSKIDTCSNCGAISFDLSENCMNCGANLNDINTGNQLNKKPSESTIDVQAEEIK